MPGTDRLEGRHALVCGASLGIGRATAVMLAGRGAKVTVLARSESALSALCAELSAAGATEPAYVVGDLDRREPLVATVKDLVERRGPVHIWVNNTGGPPAGRLLEATEDQLLVALGRFVLASQRILQVLAPGMAEAKWGRIVNVLSTSVREPIPNLGVSNLCRAAVASWAKTLSRELPPGVTINNVLPGFTATPRLDELAAGNAAKSGRTAKDVLAAWATEAPEGRLAEPEEIAAVITFLCSEGGSFVRGATVPADGGRLRSI